MQSIGEMIEDVQQKPEFIRRRYMYGCVAVTMVFILGIWLLSITEGFRSAATEAPEIRDQAAQIIPKTESTPSLSTLLDQGKSLQINDTGNQAENYFEKNLQAPADASNTPPATPGN